MDVVNLDESGKKALRSFCGEMSASMTRMEGEREFQREAIKEFADKWEIDKKLLRQVARVYHKQNFYTVSGEQHTMEEVYRQVFEVDEDA